MLLKSGNRSGVFERSNERGGILPFLAIVAMAIFGIVALLIDHSREANTAKDLQATVDAAALAGVAELDSSRDGWARVKPAVISALSKNTVLGQNAPFPRSILLTGAPADPLVTTGHTGTSASQGDWDVKVERGWYGWKSASSEEKFQFVSLEGQAEGALSNDIAVPGAMGLPVYTFANAVRVTVAIKNVSTTFGKQYAETFGDIIRTSIAASDSKLEECVAPFAIPACQLMLNTRDGSSTYDDSGYNADMACERELVFAEANAEGNYFRQQGITRSESYPRPPYLSGRLNRRAVPIRGVLGIPDDTTDAASATPEQVGQVFKDFVDGRKRDNCPFGLRARIGGRFKPVDQLVPNIAAKDLNNDGIVDTTPAPLPGFYGDAQVEQAIATYINGGEIHFRDAFPMSSRNRPKLRTLKPGYINPDTGVEDPEVELRVEWPTEYGGLGDPCVEDGTCNQYAGEMLMGDMLAKNPTAWTSPMCHSSKIPSADFLGTNDDGARVRRVKIPVIAPSDAAATPYCDWDSVFAGREQNAYLPESGTNPVIVGFTEIDLFDFNIMNLGAADGDGTALNHDGASPNTVYFQVKNAGGAVVGEIEDRNPVGMERVFNTTNAEAFVNDLGTFLQDSKSLFEQQELANCAVDPGCDPLSVIRTGALISPNSRPYLDYLKCFNFFRLGLTVPMPVANSNVFGRNVREPEFCADPTQRAPLDNVALINLYLSGGQVSGIDVNYYLGILQQLTNTPGPPLTWSSGINEMTDALRVAQVLKDAETANAGACSMLSAFLDLVLDGGGIIVPVAMSNGPNDPTASTSGGPNRAQMHCMPWKRNNDFDVFDPRSWDDPTPLAPQYGCGGLRARLRCNDASTGNKRSFVTPDGTTGSMPMLVK